MVVDVLVNIEGCENIKSVAKVHVPRNGRVTSEDREEVCGAHDTVNMDHGHDSVAVIIDIRLDDPHPVVWIGLIERL